MAAVNLRRLINLGLDAAADGSFDHPRSSLNPRRQRGLQGQDHLTITPERLQADKRGKGDHVAGPQRPGLPAAQTALSAPFPPSKPSYSAGS